MSPEIKGNAPNRISTKEKIMRPLAAAAIGASTLFGLHENNEIVENSYAAEANYHILTVDEPYELIVREKINMGINNYEEPLSGPEPLRYTVPIYGLGKDFDPEEEIRLQKEAEAKILAEKEVEEKKNAQKVVAPPKNNIVQAASVAGENSTIKVITGYYCEYDSGYYGDGGGFCGHMANGENTYDGAAACGPSYPLGTVFNIEGYGVVTCKDRGDGVPDNHIDVFTYFSSGLSSIPSGTRAVTKVE